MTDENQPIKPTKVSIWADNLKIFHCGHILEKEHLSYFAFTSQQGADVNMSDTLKYKVQSKLEQACYQSVLVVLHLILH